ncbi:MAG: c-type cytochrome [Azospirillaceae bacterium]
MPYSRTAALTGASLIACAVMPASAQDDLVARGAYLMNGPVACGNCHTPIGPEGPDFSRELAGGMVFDEGIFVAYAANITPHEETGIGAWSDEELGRAIREGLRPDGSLIGPPMAVPFYRAISDDDLAALIAYIRQLPPVDNVVPESVYNIPLPPAYGRPITEPVSAPDPSDQVAYGGYLVEIAHCMDCHTPRTPDGMLIMDRMGAGGFPFHGPWGISVSRNITPHEEGLGEWTDEEIIRAITQGISRDGSQLAPPMGFGYYANMTQDDLAAIVAYLRTIPPQESVRVE